MANSVPTVNVPAIALTPPSFSINAVAIEPKNVSDGIYRLCSVTECLLRLSS